MRILAIDIGTSLVKCVLVETKFKRTDIILHDIVPVSDALSPIAASDSYLSAGQIAALREVELRHSKNIDRIVSNLPFSLYSNRLQNFPLKDKRKIMQAVQFAVEDEIPFNIDDCIISSHIFPSKTKESYVLTGFAPFAPLQNFVNTIESIHLPLDALVMEQAATASYLTKVKKNLKNIAIINLGHRKSTITIYRNGIPFLHRTTMVGGYHITQAIAKKYEISMPEAEIAKQDRAFLADPSIQLEEDQRFFATMIESVLDPAFHDFDQTLMAHTSRANENLQTVYLCGGTSLLPGIKEYLTKRWNIPVEYFLAISQLSNTSLPPQKNMEIFLASATALSVSQVSGDEKTSFNFRSGKLKSVRSAQQFNWKQFAYPMKLASVIYIFMALSFIAQIIVLKSQEADKEKKLDSAIQSIYGKTSLSFINSLKSNPQKLRQGVDKKVGELSSQLAGGGETSNFSPLDVLNSLSKAVSTSAISEIKQMQLSTTNITLKMESPSQQDAENAMKQLGIASILQSPKFSPIENAGTRKKYSLSSNLNLPKDGL